MEKCDYHIKFFAFYLYFTVFSSLQSMIFNISTKNFFNQTYCTSPKFTPADIITVSSPPYYRRRIIIIVIITAITAIITASSPPDQHYHIITTISSNCQFFFIHKNQVFFFIRAALEKGIEAQPRFLFPTRTRIKKYEDLCV